MWQFKNKKNNENGTVLNKLRPGESAPCGGLIPRNVGRAVIKIDYSDEFGNEYQTSCTLDFIQRKVVSQEYRVVKKIKDVGDDIPKLVVDEDSIDWPNVNNIEKKK